MEKTAGYLIVDAGKNYHKGVLKLSLSFLDKYDTLSEIIKKSRF